MKMFANDVRSVAVPLSFDRFLLVSWHNVLKGGSNNLKHFLTTHREGGGIEFLRKYNSVYINC